MQEASALAPNRDTVGVGADTWMGIGSSSINGGSGEVMRMVEENAVVVFATRGCCMSYVVRRLLQALGANPAVYVVEDDDGMIGQLADACGGRWQFPAVFIGGRWFGGPERIIAAHIMEELTPLLKQPGALWL